MVQLPSEKLGHQSEGLGFQTQVKEVRSADGVVGQCPHYGRVISSAPGHEQDVAGPEEVGAPSAWQGHPIKGFAVTLSLGIITSMFSAIMVTRAMVNLAVGGRDVKKLWL